MSNKAQCKLCKTIVESKSRHDFARCRCGAIAIDGGEDYYRRVGYPENFLPVKENPCKDS